MVAVCRKPSPELEALGTRIIACVDVTDADSIEKLARSLEGTRLDVLVHNAGILRAETLGDISKVEVPAKLMGRRMTMLLAHK